MTPMEQKVRGENQHSSGCTRDVRVEDSPAVVTILHLSREQIDIKMSSVAGGKVEICDASSLSASQTDQTRERSYLRH